MEIIKNINAPDWQYNDYFQLYNDAEGGYIVGKIVKSTQEDFSDGASWIPIFDKTDKPEPFYYVIYTTPNELMKTFYSSWDHVDRIKSMEVANILNNQSEFWHLGDVVRNGEHYGLIVKDHEKDYTIMPLNLKDNKAYDANHGFSSPYLIHLQDTLSDWHKVNAHLVVED